MLTKNDIEIIKSKNFSQLPAAESAINLIFCDLNEIKTRFVFIGDKLREIQQFKYYEKFGYTDIVEFAEHVFGFGKSTTYSLININRMFCNGNSLLPEYKDFSKSQLEEMSSMLSWQTLSITSDFTVSEIRDYKKALGVGGFSYKGINFKNAREIINEYRKDQELKKQNKIPDVRKDFESSNSQVINLFNERQLNKFPFEDRLLLLFKNRENFSLVASKILSKHYKEPDCKFTYKENVRPFNDLFPCMCNVLYIDILEYLNNPSILDD